ncbi:MAG: excinuclease ABC subunit UvrC [Candidatus Micrarchaeota archaeon]
MEFDRQRYPRSPGVYLMKDAQGQVIYVGKAISLRDRLSSYFTGSRNIKTETLVRSIADIEFIVTKSEGEALILESNLIKSYNPRFNMVLKDDKHFSYLAITDEDFPRLLVARRNSKGDFKVKAKQAFGPFIESSKRALSARYLRKLFKIRVCNKMPKKECLQYHIGNCDAPCTGRISREDYLTNVSSLAEAIKGSKETRDIMKSLGGRMKAAAQREDFESAAALRDQMASLEIFFARQGVEQKAKGDEDFIAFRRIGDMLFVQILRSHNGVIGKTIKHRLEIRGQEDPELAFCLQFYQGEMPDRIYSDLKAKDMGLLNSALGTDAFRGASGRKKKTLEIASQSIGHSEVDPAVLSLKEDLELKGEPITIETFDISTLFGEDSVGSMVRFLNGKPDKAGYRKFKIKGVEGQDDFSMMREVVFRRYSRLLKEGSAMPDLVLIDGGAGQLHSAMSALEELGLQLPIASLAKREEEVYLPQMMHPLSLPRNSPSLKLLQRCRDEAHRFAISYHRKRREKSITLAGTPKPRTGNQQHKTKGLGPRA